MNKERILRTAFARVFSRFLRDHGIKTFYALSRKTGMNAVTCRKMFQDTYTGPNWPTVQILAKSFDYTPSQFVAMLEKKSKKIG